MNYLIDSVDYIKIYHICLLLFFSFYFCLAIFCALLESRWTHCVELSPPKADSLVYVFAAFIACVLCFVLRTVLEERLTFSHLRHIFVLLSTIAQRIYVCVLLLNRAVLLLMHLHSLCWSNLFYRNSFL